jgi:hypothetical protein
MQNGTQESPIQFPRPFPPPSAELEPETEATSDFEVPEPDFPSFEDKTAEELEEEVFFLSEGHLRDLGEIGPRVYWLNEKFKARKKRKGTGAKAYCERISFDLDHWRYLVRTFEPPERKAARLAAKGVRPTEKGKSTFKTFDDVKKLIKKCLLGRPAAEQIAELEGLGYWVANLMEEVEVQGEEAA